MENKFTNIKERILYLIELKGFTKEDFFSKIDMSYGSFKGSAKKRPLNSTAIANILTIVPDVNFKWLILGDGKPLLKPKSYSQAIKRPNVIREPSQVPKLITVDSQGNENIVFVPVAARAGYLNGYGDEDFIKSLPTYRLPMVNNGTFRMFEVKGNSMTPTLHSGCIVVGEWVEDWSNIKDNQIYIIITDEGIVVKRVLNRLEKYGNLFLKSDNRSEHRSYPVKTDEIKEIWKVNLAMLYNLLDPSSLFDRINDLEADVLNLKHNLDKK
ncbi:LexA family transcriptional regulator [Winogradskyella undariae]|uniref:S24 family peptidase n=1 Tax=Winogradskyella undariae TaxID=1285465 RepID=UPI00156A77C3|nr:LexA family transcriptional regulator [Winogradskyella undariae]NRR90618.1 LexA family transcriptional regulator [Winogradskyella undariae]